MKFCNVKDNSEFPKSTLEGIGTLTSKIEGKTTEQLAREGVLIYPSNLKDSEDLDGDKTVLRSTDSKYKTSNIMGFLGLGDERLVIGSRFSNGQDDYLLQYLLSRAMGFPNIVTLKTDANQDLQLFNFLLYLFPQSLTAAMRKGLFKQYVWRNYNDANLKGSIDFAQHLRLNTPFVGNIAYRQREFSYDNDLLELVRHTIEFIKGKRGGASILRQAKDQVKLVVEATPAYERQNRQKIINTNKKNPVRHAYYREYRDLQKICLMILRNEKHQIGTGTRQINGLLFDGATLWEEYVNTLIGSAFYHPNNRTGEGRQWLFTGPEKVAGEIYPDFISRATEPRVIADAKYKPARNIGRDDNLQILAYMFRFDSKTGYFLYPKSQNESNQILRMNSGSSFENNVVPRSDATVTKLGLKIPEAAESYEDFVVTMHQNEQEFINTLAI